MKRLLITLLLLMAFTSAASAATPAAVDESVKKAIESLYARQKNGNWENVAAPEEGGHDSTEGGQWGGLTSVVTYALLSAGEKPTDPRLASAIEFLHNAKFKGVYAVGMRAQVWPLLPPSAKVTSSARRDAKLLMDSMKTKGNALGMWLYFLDEPKDERGDHSASQIAVLGLWACQEVGVEIPDKFWQLQDTVWRQHQTPDGGWAYVYKDGGAWGQPTLSMTVAGMATLFLTQDQLKRGSTACNGNPKDPILTKGMEWVGREFPKDKNFNNSQPRVFFPGGPGRPYYLLYGLGRLGVYSGYRYFSNIDWFQAGADFLLKEQKADGAWSDTTWESALGLLFLARGRAPVAINKLNYSGAGSDTPPWNQRPRDAANLTHWMGRQLERRLNWQIVDLASDPLEWMESPILYISGSDELKFSTEQQAKLREYVEAGGLIVGNADCGAAKFATSFKKLGIALFSDAEFRELPAEHVIYNNQAFPRKKWKAKVGIQGLSNGVRERMILFADADPAKGWQTQNSVSRSELFESMADIYQYVAGSSAGRNKGDTVVVKPDTAIKTDKKLSVARLQYSANWNPEPGGWRRLAALMHNQQKTELDVQIVELGKGKLSKDFAVAHLTGTNAFKLTDAGRAEIKSYVDGGGVLVVDAAGGNGEFAASAENEIAAIFPDGKLNQLPPEHPVFHQPNDLPKVGFRSFARKTNGDSTAARLFGLERNGRLAVIFSPLDLSAGLVGTSVDGINGYDPASSVSLMINCINLAKK